MFYSMELRSPKTEALSSARGWIRESGAYLKRTSGP
jgi:hypothetical protein